MILKYIEKKSEEYLSQEIFSNLIEENKKILKLKIERDILLSLCEEMFSLISVAKYRFPEEADQKPMLEVIVKIETGS